MRYLLIAEKPSLMRTIQDVYNKHKSEIGYDCDFLAQAGHLMRLKQPKELNKKYEKWTRENYPMDLTYEYRVIEGKEDLYKKIKSAVTSGQYDRIIHAGDPDQEGELLVRLPLMHMGNRLPVDRFWSNDLTEGAVLYALTHLKDDKEFDGYYQAALLRQHMDYQYGMNMTGVMTIAMGPTIRIGRVKAPIIHILAAREKEIEDFVPHSDYVHEADVKGYPFLGETRYATEGEAKETLPGKFAVMNVTDKKVQRKAGKLYKLSTLQSVASSLYGFSGAKTLALCQSLYEKKLLSYPRTDCEYLASHTDAESILNNLGHLIHLSQYHLQPMDAVKQDGSYFNDKAIGSEGHTAIIPTGEFPQGLTGDEEKIFDLVLRKFASIFGMPKTVRTVKADGVSENREKYSMSVEEVLDPGFELILNPNYQGSTCSHETLTKGVCEPKDVTFTTHEIKAKCPSRYTDGTLISALDHPVNLSKKLDSDAEETGNYKIGTPATRANIIEDCIKSGYFKREKGKFFASPLAMTLMKQLGWVKLFDIQTTAKWEHSLNEIRNGEVPMESVEKTMMDTMRESVDEVLHADIKKIAAGYPGGKRTPIGKCPLCGGDVYEYTKSFGCSNWKTKGCKFTLWKRSFMDYSITKTDAKKLIEGKTIKKVVTSKKGNHWEQELFYNKDTNRVEFYEKGKGGK